MSARLEAGRVSVEVGEGGKEEREEEGELTRSIL